MVLSFLIASVIPGLVDSTGIGLPTPPSGPPCATPIDFALLLDESGSMKKPKPVGSMEGPNGSKAFAKELVSQYSLGMDAAIFSVVSFASVATTRVSWSYDAAVIKAGIDNMKADGKTNIVGGFEAVQQLFAHSRVGATKVLLLVSDGKQSDQFGPLQTVVEKAALVKKAGVTVFAWGFGRKVKSAMLQQIATDDSKATLADDIAGLRSYLNRLEAAVCNLSPPLSPPVQGASAREQQTQLREIIGDDSSSLSGGGGNELPWWLPLLLLLCLPACLLGAKKRQKMKRAHVEDNTDLGLGDTAAAPTKKPNGSLRESFKRSNRGSVYGATETEAVSIRLEEVDTQRLSSCSPGLPDDWNTPLDEHDTAA